MLILARGGGACGGTSHTEIRNKKKMIRECYCYTLIVWNHCGEKLACGFGRRGAGWYLGGGGGGG